LDLDLLDGIVSVDDGDAILIAQRLSAELGLGVGISSGANFLGALKVMEDLGEDAVVVTMFPDDNKKYLSTGLLGAEPREDSYLAPRIKLQAVTAFKRVCYTCCNPRECMEESSIDIATEGALPHCPRRS
jgi:cysteine synthase A